jgi:hypothetical protein
VEIFLVATGAGHAERRVKAARHGGMKTHGALSAEESRSLGKTYCSGKGDEDGCDTPRPRMSAAS